MEQLACGKPWVLTYVYAFDHHIKFCDTEKNPKLRYTV